MNTFDVYRGMNAIRLLLAAVLFLEGTSVGFARMLDAPDSIENVQFDVAGELVRINYDLNAPLDKVHVVRLVLYRESDPTFSYRPVNVTGDVGTIVFPGQKRRIVWEFTKEFPEGLTGTDYYFVVEAEWIAPEKSHMWWWIGGGAAVAGGLITVLLLKKSPGGDIINTNTDFPNPPGRP
jgi:hypothetical protein